MIRLVWLGDPVAQGRNLVGSKVATLSQLVATQPVPPGFCLTTLAFAETIDAWTTAGPPDLPAALLDELTPAYEHLATLLGRATPAVAVRSSAIGEDSAAAIVVDRYASFLNVVGLEAIAAAVGRCWSLPLTASLAAGTLPVGVTVAPTARLAILIQSLVVADVSAVVYSMNPITGSHDELVITASWGLGESLAGGSVTPDTIILRKAPLGIALYQVADKRRMTVAVDGGTAELAVPRPLRQQAVLDDAQVLALAGATLELETRLGHPVGVEWAYQAEQLHLLQCRSLRLGAHLPLAQPVTTRRQPRRRHRPSA